MTTDGVIPFGTGLYDLVFSITLLSTQRMNSLKVMFGEINRVLKNGGMCVMVGLIWSPVNLLRLGTRHSRLTKITSEGRPPGENPEVEVSNRYLERALIQPDGEMLQLLEQMGFEMRETLYGSWSGTSMSSIYQDVITLVKSENLKK
jgi:hypothetical protein